MRNLSRLNQKESDTQTYVCSLTFHQTTNISPPKPQGNLDMQSIPSLGDRRGTSMHRIQSLQSLNSLQTFPYHPAHLESMVQMLPDSVRGVSPAMFWELEEHRRSQLKRARSAPNLGKLEDTEVQKKKRRKYRRKKNDPQPKKPKTPYTFYQLSVMPRHWAIIEASFAHEGREKQSRRVAQLTGSTWKQMSQEERKPFIEMAATDSERYKKELISAYQKEDKSNSESNSHNNSDDETSAEPINDSTTFETSSTASPNSITTTGKVECTEKQRGEEKEAKEEASGKAKATDKRASSQTTKQTNRNAATTPVPAKVVSSALVKADIPHVVHPSTSPVPAPIAASQHPQPYIRVPVMANVIAHPGDTPLLFTRPHYQHHAAHAPMLAGIQHLGHTPRIPNFGVPSAACAAEVARPFIKTPSPFFMAAAMRSPAVMSVDTSDNISEAQRSLERLAMCALQQRERK